MASRTTVSDRALALVWMSALAVGACKNDAGGDGDATAEGTSQGSLDGGSETSTSSESSGGPGEDTGIDPPKYDLGGVPDAPAPLSCDGGKGGGGGGTNDPLYSYIWISNSSQGTVSKIDTVTLEEVGRYDTHPMTGDPSRTSVSLNGNVAVANRNGGLVKFFANKADCQDKNGNGVIDTSTGANDVLPWDEEECRAWFTPFDYTSQRPVAWTPGQWDPSSCRYENEKVWTAGASDSGSPIVRIARAIVRGESWLAGK